MVQRMTSGLGITTSSERTNLIPMIFSGLSSEEEVECFSNTDFILSKTYTSSADIKDSRGEMMKIRTQL
jgi:hypothetical protein